jgi:hypothetical protein
MGLLVYFLLLQWFGGQGRRRRWLFIGLGCVYGFILSFGLGGLGNHLGPSEPWFAENTRFALD